MADPAPIDAKTANSGEKSPSLARVLGLGIAVAMVMGNVIGAGIFLKPGVAAEAAGSFPFVISAWVLGGLICVLGALCLAELATMFTRAGGLYVYLREAYGRPTAFLFAWSEFLFGRPASIAAMAVGITFVAGLLRGEPFSYWSAIGIQLGIIIFLTAINYLGVLWGGLFQGGTTIIKAGFLVALAVLPLVLIPFGGGGADSANFSTTITPAQATWFGQLAVALMAVLWAYNGWHACTPVAEEIRNPQRNLPRAILGGLGAIIVIYLAVNIAYHAVVPIDQIQKAGMGLPQVMMGIMFADFGAGAVATATWIVSLAAIISIAGSMNTNFINGPRVLLAVSREERILHPLAYVHPRFRTPTRAILVQGIMCVLMLAGGLILIELDESFRGKNVFDILTNYVIYSASLFFLLAVGAVMILRRTQPETERSYRTPGYPFVPIAYLVLNIAFLSWYAIEEPRQALIGIGLTLIGLPAYFLIRRLPNR